MSAQVRVVSFEAAPAVASGAAASASGAFANIYLIASCDETAVEQAKREVSRAGWSAVSVPEVRVVTPADFSETPDGLAYYEQCLLDGVVVVLHTWRQAH